jgi:hypothetical protein
MDDAFQCWSDTDALPGTSVCPTVLRHYKDAPRYVVLNQVHKAMQSNDNERTSFSAFRAAVTDANCEITRIISPEARSDLADTGCVKANTTRVYIAVAISLAKALKRMGASLAIRKALKTLDTASPPPNAPVNRKCPRRKTPVALPHSPPPPELQMQT